MFRRLAKTRNRGALLRRTSQFCTRVTERLFTSTAIKRPAFFGATEADDDIQHIAQARRLATNNENAAPSGLRMAYLPHGAKLNSSHSITMT